MPKPQDIFQLARQEAVRVTASPQAWQSFLYTAAHNYHTTYLNQLLIHAQRPDAAACAGMGYWNKQAKRLVMRGSKDRKSTRLNSSHPTTSRMPSSA